MELHSHKPKRFSTGQSCALHLDALTEHAVQLALQRTATALESGLLLSPGEALAIAGPEAREKETLFSIARQVAFETGLDQADILCRLGERYPVYA